MLDAALEAMRQQQASAATTNTQDQGDDGDARADGGHTGAQSANGDERPAGADRGYPAPGTDGSPTTASSTGRMQGTGGGTAGASAIELARLERELGSSMERFDDTLASERAHGMERAEELGSRTHGTNSPASGATGNDEELPGYGTTRTGGDTRSDAAIGDEGGYASGGGNVGGSTPGAQQQATAPVPADIPDGSGDDVVARQIREAAMKEKDPELREKLWDEYRKYTGLTKEKAR